MRILIRYGLSTNLGLRVGNMILTWVSSDQGSTHSLADEEDSDNGGEFGEVHV